MGPLGDGLMLIAQNALHRHTHDGPASRTFGSHSFKAFHSTWGSTFCSHCSEMKNIGNTLDNPQTPLLRLTACPGHPEWEYWWCSHNILFIITLELLFDATKVPCEPSKCYYLTGWMVLYVGRSNNVKSWRAGRFLIAARGGSTYQRCYKPDSSWSSSPLRSLATVYIVL